MCLFHQKRPPRIKRFSPRRLIEWLTDTRRKTGPSASDESTSTTMIVAAGDNDSEAENTGTIRRASKATVKIVVIIQSLKSSEERVKI